MLNSFKMAASSGRVDEFVKDYLIFRGLSSTLRVLESELKVEKEKGFRVDKIVDQLMTYLAAYDLQNLKDYWQFLNTRLFSRLEERYRSSVKKLEIGLLKFYLVNAAQNGRQDKIMDFFERMLDILQSYSEFKEWFVFPFVRNHRDHAHFGMYFTPQWQDTFLLSLHNFLSVILQAMPGPTLLNFEAELRRNNELQEENHNLKLKLQTLGQKPDADEQMSQIDRRLSDRGHAELMYDFSSLGEDTAIQEPVSKSSKKFSFPSSPLSIGKKSDKQPPPTKKKEDSLKMSFMLNKVATKGAKTLPASTGQKNVSKSKVLSAMMTGVTGVTVPLDTATSNTAEVTANQKLQKKLEDARARKELLEGNGEKTKPKEEKTAPVTEGVVSYKRSVSESAGSVGQHSPRTARSVSTKTAPNTKTWGTYSSPPKLLPEVGDEGHTSVSMDTVSPLATATVATMIGTVAPEKAQEMQTFPLHSSSQSLSSLTDDGLPVDPNIASDIAKAKPFLLLSQDEYGEHRSSISYARFSNSGQYIASVDVDGVVKVWAWSPQAVTAATVMSKSAFLSLEWASKSDRWLLLGNRSGNIRLFDVKEMKSFYEASADLSYPRIIGLYSSPTCQSFVCSACVGRVRSGSLGVDTGPSRDARVGKLTIWDLKTMKAERTLPLEPGPVGITSCSFNHNGQLLIAGGVDGIIRLFDVTKQKCVSQWTAHVGEVRQVLYSADYTACYSLGQDGQMCEWSMHKTGKKLRDLPLPQGSVPDYSALEGSNSKEIPAGKLLALDTDGKYLLGRNGISSEIYQINSSDPGMVPVMTVKGHRSSPITTVDWSPNIDTKICLTGDMNGSIIVSTLLTQ